jgi:hypothetical protein
MPEDVKRVFDKFQHQTQDSLAHYAKTAARTLQTAVLCHF